MIFVYALPAKMSDGYCFGGGRRIPFLNLDWFEGFPEMTEDELRKEVQGKIYMPEHHRVLVLSPERLICMFVEEGE